MNEQWLMNVRARKTYKVEWNARRLPVTRAISLIPLCYGFALSHSVEYRQFCDIPLCATTPPDAHPNLDTPTWQR